MKVLGKGLKSRGRLMHQVDAFIFDMDGVLIDSEPLHFAAFREYLAGLGVDYGERKHRDFIGRTSREIFLRILEENPTLDLSADEMILARQGLFAEAIAKPLSAMEGTLELLTALAGRGIRLGLASGSNRFQVETILRNLNYWEAFECVTTGEEVEQSKPSPQIYQLACARMKVNPSKCIVIEDSAPGVLAAIRAGSYVVAVPCGSTRAHDLTPAHEEMKSLAPFPLDEVLSRFDAWHLRG